MPLRNTLRRNLSFAYELTLESDLLEKEKRLLLLKLLSIIFF